ncbi:MAG: MBL fold metallo-hydrolase [Clostridiales bacterium]|nr:MBL fold metallo-hydrolase [Clostridiales bacterium]
MSESQSVKIRFLGTSHGLPEKDRFCSSAIVESGGERYMIDAGAPVVALCVREGIDPQFIRACFVTHMHGDHANGLLELGDYINYFRNSGPAPAVFLPEQAGVDAMTAWIKVVGGGIRRLPEIRVYGAGQVFSEEGFSLEARPSDHLRGRPAYSFAVTAGQKRILFSGDIGGDMTEFLAHALKEKWDAVVVEAAHNDLDVSAEKLRGLDTGLLIVNHFSPKRNGEKFEILRSRVPFACELARDGSVFEL